MSLLAQQMMMMAQPSGPPGYWYTPLFAHAEIGIIIDYNDLTTQFQDTAGTVPVTAVGQPIHSSRCKASGALATYSSGNVLALDSTTGLYTCAFNGSAPGTMAIPSGLAGVSDRTLIAVATFTGKGLEYATNLGAAAASVSLYVGNDTGQGIIGTGGSGNSFFNLIPFIGNSIVIGTCQGNSLKLYKNATVVALGNTSVDTNIAPPTVTLGGYPFTGYNFTGPVFSIVSLNRVVNSAEITAINAGAL